MAAHLLSEQPAAADEHMLVEEHQRVLNRGRGSSSTVQSPTSERGVGSHGEKAAKRHSLAYPPVVLGVN